MAPARATWPLRLCLVLAAALAALPPSGQRPACCGGRAARPGAGHPRTGVLRLRGGGLGAGRSPTREQASARGGPTVTPQQAGTLRGSRQRAAPDTAAADGDDDEDRLRASLQGELAAAFGDMKARAPHPVPVLRGGAPRAFATLGWGAVSLWEAPCVCPLHPPAASLTRVPSRLCFSRTSRRQASSS
jgi:hypothetical protein